MVISTAVRSRSTVLEANVYLSDIFFGCLKIRHSTVQELALETIRNIQTNNTITTYKEFLGTCLKSKKSSNIYSMYKLAKIFQTSRFTTFGSSACHGSLS